MRNKIKFALIGCGAIANKHVTALRHLENVEISGVYDLDADASEDFSRRNEVPTYTSIDELMSKASPDVLNILTPSGNHGRCVLDLIKYGKHFVVEKPLALRLSEIDEILDKCDRSGQKVFVVKQNRFNPPIQKTKQALDEGRFGKLVLGSVRIRWKRDQKYYDQKPWRGTWEADGGVLTNQASHHIDMLVWLMGDVESVMAKSATRLVNIEAEDTGVAILKFKNGAIGIVEATTATRPKDLEGSISILGEKGTAEIGGFFMNELKTWNFEQEEAGDEVIWRDYAKVPEDIAWNHTEFFRDVVASLQSGSKGLIDGLEGRRSVELINAIYESIETGREVFLRFTPKMCKLGMRNEK